MKASNSYSDVVQKNKPISSSKINFDQKKIGQNALIEIVSSDNKNSDIGSYQINQISYYVLIMKLVKLNQIQNLGVIHDGGALVFHFLAQYMLKNNKVPEAAERKNLFEEFKIKGIAEEDRWFKANEPWCNFADNKTILPGKIQRKKIQRHPVRFHRTSNLLEHELYSVLLKKLKDFSVSSEEYKNAMQEFSESIVKKEYKEVEQDNLISAEVKQAVIEVMLDYTYFHLLTLALCGKLQKPNSAINPEIFFNYDFFYSAVPQDDLAKKCLELTYQCLQIIGMTWVNILFHDLAKQQKREVKQIEIEEVKQVNEKKREQRSPSLDLSSDSLLSSSSPSSSSSDSLLRWSPLSRLSLSAVMDFNSENERSNELSSEVKINSLESKAIPIPLLLNDNMRRARNGSNISSVIIFSDGQESLYQCFLSFFAEQSPIYKSITKCILEDSSLLNKIDRYLCMIKQKYDVLEDAQDNIETVLKNLSKMDDESLKNFSIKGKSPFLSRMRSFKLLIDATGKKLIKLIDDELIKLYLLLSGHSFPLILNYLKNSDKWNEFRYGMNFHLKNFIQYSLSNQVVLFRIKRELQYISSSYLSSSPRLTRLPPERARDQQMQNNLASEMAPSEFNPKSLGKC